MHHLSGALIACILLMPLPATGQGTTIGYGDNGLSVGNAPRTNGVRLNFRDRGLQYVNGLNLTIWHPHQPASGVVSGVAVGIPSTGASRIRGFSVGILGVQGEREITGVGIGGIGIGAGRNLTGLFVGGLGVGSGRDLTGVFVGGLGAGGGGSGSGFFLGGLGAGVAHDLDGLVVGGLGAGAGEDIHGIVLAGLGAGAGRDFDGIGVAGLGVGAGRDVRGIMLAAIGTGAGRSFTGIGIAGVAAGAPEVRGLIVAPTSGGEQLAGVFLTPAYVRLEPDGSMRGFSVSAFNHMRGDVHGLTIGIFNYARALHGVQIGLLNFAGNNPAGLRWLPVLNAHFD